MKHFLIINAIVVALLIAYILGRRPTKSKARLRLGKASSSSKLKAHTEDSEVRRFDSVDGAQDEPGHERSVNVIFTYNCHDWDAYEVLGIPAGSSIETVDRAYKQGLARVEVSSQGLIRAAYEAIRTSIRQSQ